MEKRVSATEAKTHLGALLREAAEKGQTVIVERSGIPRVAIVPFDEFERMKKGAKWGGREVILQRIETFRETLHARLMREGVELPDIDIIIDQARAERDDQVIDSLR